MGRLTTVLSFWSVLIVLLPPRTTTFAEGQGDCILNFTQQPVTGIDCEVYQEPVIVLTCSVESLSQQAFPDPSLIEIRWYFYNGTEYELTTGVGHTRTGGNGDHVQVTSTLNVSGTSNQQFAFLGEGFYYCQVQMTDITVETNTSQRFQVLSRDAYVQAGTSCRERTFIANVESCAAYKATAPTTQHQTTTDVVYDTKALSTVDSETTAEIALTKDTNTSKTTTSAGGDADSGEQSLQIMWIAIIMIAVAVILVTTVITSAIFITLRRRSSKSRKSNENETDQAQDTTQCEQRTKFNDTTCYCAGTDETGNIEMQCCDAYKAVKQSESEMDYSYIYESVK